MGSGRPHHRLEQDGSSECQPWVLNTSATTHLSSLDGILFSHLPHPDSFIIVGNGNNIPISCSCGGTSTLLALYTTILLGNVLVASTLVCYFLFASSLVIVIVPSSLTLLTFSVKDQQTKCTILCCNSSGDLYIITSSPPYNCSLATSSTLWHHRLGHPGASAIAMLRNMSFISYHKVPRSLCPAYQLGKHTRLPFRSPAFVMTTPFDLIPCYYGYLWFLALQVYKYYLVFLDDYSHFCWSFPLYR